ncbi:MAG: alginate export family protein [Vicinamibacteria bacterium]
MERVALGRAAGLALAFVWLLAAETTAQPAPVHAPESDAGDTVITIGVMTRAELWRYFQPPPDALSDPAYVLYGARGRVGVRHREGRWRLAGGIQYVRVEPLPQLAIGPGALGSGGLYQFHAQSTFSYQLYLRELALGVEVAPGLEVMAGRLRIEDGGAAPASAALADLRPRVEGRLLGSFSWALYERAFDGVRVDVSRPSWHLHAMAAQPTQGAYEMSANLGLRGLEVAGVALTTRHGTRAETQAFAWGYRDRREVSGRPDNTGRVSRAADVAIATVGASHLARWSTRAGEMDVVLWGAAQAGRWYELDHLAWSATAEAGHRWPRAPWRPWVRAGVLVASGDGDARDDRHGTFFPMLPSVERQSASTVYAPMNLVDVFARVAVSPHARVDAGVELHRVSLASADDAWYTGGGATMRRGTYFGYSRRPSGGATSLATVVEGTLDVRIAGPWSARVYAASIAGGDVVRRSFAGTRLRLLAVETAIRF